MKPSIYFLLIALLLSTSLLKAQSPFDTNGQFEFVEELPVQEGLLYGPGRLHTKGKFFLTGMDDENTMITRIYKISMKDYASLQLIEVEVNSTDMSIYQPVMDSRGKTMIVAASTSDSWADNDLYEARQNANGQYGPLKKLDALNDTQVADAYPWLSAKGKSIYYTRDSELFFGKRSSLDADFSVGQVVAFAGENTSNIMSSWLPKNRKEIYFVNSAGEIWRAKRIDDLHFESPTLFTDEFTTLDFISSISFDKKMKNLWMYLSDEENITHILHYRLK